MDNIIFCRYLRCGMKFTSEYHRAKHENVMHKELMKEAVMLLLQRVETTNSIESFKKKVLKTPIGTISYKEAKEKVLQDDEEGKVVLETLKNIVNSYFNQYPEYGMDQIKNLSEFKIR